jgi:hypothetical protein
MALSALAQLGLAVATPYIAPPSSLSRAATVSRGPKPQRWNRSTSGLYDVNSRYQDVDGSILDIGDSLEANSDVSKGFANKRAPNVSVDDIATGIPSAPRRRLRTRRRRRNLRLEGDGDNFAALAVA